MKIIKHIFDGDFGYEELHMNKKDQMTVENFVSTGMDLETLYSCFQDFPKEEIAEVYNNYKATQVEPEKRGSMSINCS